MQTRSMVIIAGFAALPIFASAPAARADVLFDDTAAASAGLAFTSVQTSGPLADSFSTGDYALYLTNVQLILGAANPADGETVTVSLLGDNATAPGTLIATLATIQDSSLSSWASPSSYDVPVANIGLTGDTRYWIELSSPRGSTAVWSYTQDLSGPGASGEYDAYGASSTVVSNANSSYGAFQMAVQAVPEPASVALLGIGIAGIGLFARRRPGQT